MKRLFITLTVLVGLLLSYATQIHAQTFHCVVVPVAGEKSRCVNEPLCPGGSQPTLPDGTVCTDHGEIMTNDPNSCPTNTEFACLEAAYNTTGLNYACGIIDGICQVTNNPCGGSLPVPCKNFSANNCPQSVSCSTGTPTSSNTNQTGSSLPPISSGNPGSVLVDLNELITSLAGQSTNPTQFNKLTALGGFVGALLPFLYAIAGIALLGFLIAGGFMFLTSAGDPKRTEAAKTMITTAIIGFIIVIVAFWATQIVQYIFLLKTSSGSGIF